ncbi:hypothetical protein JTB14_008040 [Gonioctena quinquepunctata]|nr:hypothetical protein JTB14_008040 [Gonioctena quinquepunctata]
MRVTENNLPRAQKKKVISSDSSTCYAHSNLSSKNSTPTSREDISDSDDNPYLWESTSGLQKRIRSNREQRG